MPHTRDEHSCVVHNECMLVFGGFAFGERSNSIFKYNFRMNTWEKINHKSKAAPCPRAGHSAIIRKTDNDDFMYIFGGKDDENNKLNDIWRFSFTSNTWSEISKGLSSFFFDSKTIFILLFCILTFNY